MSVSACAPLATELELDFVPLVWESYDIALGGDTLGVAQPLIAALRDRTVRAAVERLGGYDFTAAGILEPLNT